MKKVFLLCIAILTLLLQSCDPFNRPSDEWICDEIKVSLNFNYTSYTSAEGTIIMDGETKEIVCLLGSGGRASICYPDENNYYSAETECLYDGIFRYKNKDTMVLFIRKPGEGHAVETGEEYTFVKVTTTE